MGKSFRKYTRKVKIFTIQELANYFHVHRNTITLWMRDRGIDLKDPNSTMDFIRKPKG